MKTLYLIVYLIYFLPILAPPQAPYFSRLNNALIKNKGIRLIAKMIVSNSICSQKCKNYMRGGCWKNFDLIVNKDIYDKNEIDAIEHTFGVQSLTSSFGILSLLFRTSRVVVMEN